MSGGLTVQQGSSGLQAIALKFTAQLANLRSVDQVAGLDVSRRDSIVSRTLSVSQYPTATFQAESVDLPASVFQAPRTGLTKVAEVSSVPGLSPVALLYRPTWIVAALLEMSW